MTRSGGAAILEEGRNRDSGRPSFPLPPSEFRDDCKFMFIYRRWGATEGEQTTRWLALKANTAQTVAGPDYTFPAT